MWIYSTLLNCMLNWKKNDWNSKFFILVSVFYHNFFFFSNGKCKSKALLHHKLPTKHLSISVIHFVQFVYLDQNPHKIHRLWLSVLICSPAIHFSFFPLTVIYMLKTSPIKFPTMQIFQFASLWCHSSSIFLKIGSWIKRADEFKFDIWETDLWIDLETILPKCERTKD